jgi:regulator of ribonuclease activity B
MGFRRLKRKDEETPRADEPVAPSSPTQPSTDYYLYLRTREHADEVARALQGEGYTVRSSADPESERPWLVVATRVEPAEGAEAHFQQLAERLDGEYDGSETSRG